MAVRDSSNRITGTPTTITPSSGAATLDSALNDNFIITITQNTLLTASNLKAGQFITLQILTSGTTSYALAFDTPIKAKGVFKTNRQGSNYSTISFYSDGTRLIEMNRTGGISGIANKSNCILALESDWYSQTDNTSITTNWRDYSQTGFGCVPTGSITYRTNILNSRPSVRINGTDNASMYFTLPTFALGGAHFYQVWKLISGTTGGNLWGTSAFNETYHYGDNNAYLNFASTTRRTYNAIFSPASTTFHTYNGYSMPNAWRMFRDNVAFAAEDTTNTVAFPASPRLGSQGTHSVNADILALYMFDNRLTASEDAEVKAHILATYGI